MLYIDKMAVIANGLGNNQSLFNPEEFIPDAIIEELYRILSLGITGFDSPLAAISLPETKAAFSSIRFMTDAYKDEWHSLQPGSYNNITQLLDGATNYLNTHNNFNHFNRWSLL